MKTIKDMTNIAERFISLLFFLEYVFELQSMEEWKEMLDYEHEKALKRVNCMAFTDYFLKISQDLYRRWIKETIIERGKEIQVEQKDIILKINKQ